MIGFIQCNICDEEGPTGQFYSVHRNPPTEPVMENGHFCTDCIPGIVVSSLEKETFEQ